MHQHGMSNSTTEAAMSQNLTGVYMLQIVQQYTRETSWFPKTTTILLVVFYCLVIIVGLIGNFMVIIVLLRKKELRSPKNIYILNLCVCDIIMCAVCMPFSLVKLTLKKWILGLTACRIIPALTTVDVFVSTLTIVAISVDRYMAIIHSSHTSRRLLFIVLGLIWLCSILMSMPLFSFHQIETQKLYDQTIVQSCVDNWPDDLFREIYTTVIMLIQYLTPSTVISILHANICKFLRFRFEDRPGSDTQIAVKAKEDLKRHRKNMVLLTAIALVFSITWLPLTILNIMADLDHDVFKEKQYNLLHAISLLLAMSSSAINPIIYGWFNSNFRRAFYELVRLQDASGGSKKNVEPGMISDPSLKALTCSRDHSRSGLNIGGSPTLRDDPHFASPVVCDSQGDMRQSSSKSFHFQSNIQMCWQNVSATVEKVPAKFSSEKASSDIKIGPSEQEAEKLNVWDFRRVVSYDSIPVKPHVPKAETARKTNSWNNH